MAYNATVWESWDGLTDVAVFVAEVDAAGRMLRSNAVQCTGLEGSPRYDEYLRQRYPDRSFRVVRDNCAGYRARIAGLALPPAYRR